MEKMDNLQAQKKLIQTHWSTRPCGSKVSPHPFGSKEFFEDVERGRFRLEYYMPTAVDYKKYKGKKLLEVGCGLGTDSKQFAKNGADVTAIDLSSIELAKKHFDVYGLKGNFLKMDMQHLAFKDNSFDVVYSCGVIHHTPHIEKTIEEIYRVLKPGGEIVIMIYHKNSYYYYGSIMFFKKIGFRLLGWDITITPEEWLAYGTDGFGNPYAEVFTRDEARKLFNKFKQVRLKTFAFCSRDIPVLGRFVPEWVDRQLAKIWGFCLFIYAAKES